MDPVVKRARFGEGPWMYEQDEEIWAHPGTDYLLAITRHPELGHLCGYLGVPEGHLWHGKGEEDLEVGVHGGLTFARGTAPGRPGEWERPGYWWLGFDCAHFQDVVPIHYQLRQSSREDFGSYRDWQYVQDELASLVEQAEQAHNPQETP
jgi:hypothetical protein